MPEKLLAVGGTMFPKGHDVMRERILQSRYSDDTTKSKLLKLLEKLDGWMAVLAAVKLEEEELVNHPWMMERINQAISGF